MSFFRKYYYYPINYFEHTYVCKIIFLFYKKICCLKKSSLFETIIGTFSFPTYIFIYSFFIFLPRLIKQNCDHIFFRTSALYIFLSIYRETDFTPRKLLSRMSTDADRMPLHSQRLFHLFNLSLYVPRGPLVGSHVRARSLSLFSLATVAFVWHSHCFRTRLICCPVRLQLSFTTKADFNL